MSPRRRSGEGSSNSLVLRRGIGFAVAAGLLTYLALRGAGYDIVVRQQFFLAAWAAFAVGVALGFFPRGRADSRLLAIALAGFAGYVLLVVLSFSWTESDERTTAELARFIGYGGIVALALAGLNRHTFRAAAAGLSAAALVVCGIAVASRLFPGAFPHALDVANRFDPSRLTYPLDYWNAVAAWGAMSVAIALSWSAHARLSWVRAASLAAVPVAALATYLTFSRAGVVGMVVALLAVLALSHNRWTAAVHMAVAGAGSGVVFLTVNNHEQIENATGGAGGGAVLGVLVVVAIVCAATAIATAAFRVDGLRLKSEVAYYAVPIGLAIAIPVLLLAGSGRISRAYDEYKTQEQPTVVGAGRLSGAGSSRYDFWSSAKDTFEDRPIQGTGPGTFEFSWSRDARTSEFVRDAHSLYMEQLSELGLFGLLFLLAFLGGLLAAALSARRWLASEADIGASVAMIAAFMVFLAHAGLDWMWEETAVTALALGGLGIAAAAGSRRLPRHRRDLGNATRRFGLVAIAVVACITQVPGLVAKQRERASLHATRAQNYDRGRELADEAIDAESWAASPYIARGLALGLAGSFEQSERDFRTAWDKEPTNYRHPVLLARVLASQGKRKEAIKTFREAEKLRPLSPVFAPNSPFAVSIFAPKPKAQPGKGKKPRNAPRAPTAPQ